FTLSKKQKELKEGIAGLGKYVIRPMSLDMDRKHEVPQSFLRNFMMMASGFRGTAGHFGTESSEEEKPRDAGRVSETNRTAAVGAEELAWADASLLLCLPGPGLGAPPVRATGTPEQKKRFFGMFADMDKGPLKWGA